ncbi:MAG: AAA family ATPase [Candidatus Dormibacteria bacterium]
MRLERLEVTGFGRLRQRRFDFGERITVVLGPNESGKSTLHRAIRAALYGLEAGGPGHPRDRSDWARWLPWTSGRFGLTLTYRLDGGRRLRVAQTFDRDRVHAQVQELGGGDITQQFRVGRTVCPGRFHLGVDEAVFCAAAWLGEDGLQLSSADAAPQQAGHLREALERLVDAGAEGTTAAEATTRLAEALQRVGTERRVTSPLGVAIAQARRLEREMEAAQDRIASFAVEEARLRELEQEARLATEAAVAAQRAWIRGRIAQLDAQTEELRLAAGEAAELSRALEAEAAYASFPVQNEAAVIALGGELNQAARAAAEAEARWSVVQEPLGALRRRRAEISAGLQAMPESSPIGERETVAAIALRRRVEVSAAIAHRDEEVAATARGEALRREIAVTGLGGVDPSQLEAVVPMVAAARTAAARVRGAVWGLAAVTALGGGASGVVAATGRHGPAALLGAGCLLVVAALAVVGILAFRSGSRARFELAGRLPGLDLGTAGLERLAATLPAARNLHEESRQQAALVEVHRAEQMRARGELEAAVESCLALARESGLSAPTRPPAGCRVEMLLTTAAAALATVDAAAKLSLRRRELVLEDARLAERETQYAELGEEAGRSRATAEGVEERIRVATAAAGLDAGLAPLAAVSAFREGCAHRYEHDRLAARLAEARRRQRTGGSDIEALANRRTELGDDLRRRGGDPDAASGDVSSDAASLARLEREAVVAQERAARATAAIQGLRARLDGLAGSLPSLADLEDERLTVTAARDRALHQQEALQRAIAMIETAGRDVHGRLAPRLAASVSERLALLTGDHYSEANVDMDHFAIALASPDRDQLVSLDLVSHGTRDQVALLLRLALCDVLGDAGESVPLLLDEPLASADPRRGRGLLEFLAQLSATNQLVVTTSDPGIAATLVSLGDPATTEVIDLGSDGQENETELSEPDKVPAGTVLKKGVRAPRPPARGLRGR